MNTTNLHIRKVDPAEWETLQRMSRKTFFEAFAAVNTAGNMQAFLDTAFAESKLRNELNDPESDFYFACIDNEPIAYLKINFGRSQTELKTNESLEVERIYVDASAQGKGIGQLMLDYAIDIARQQKTKFIWLGVWEKNPGAIRFYERNGFAAFSQHTFKVGDDPQTDILMKKTL